MRDYSKRLLPGQDLRLAIEAFAKEHGVKAGCVVSLVGNLSKVVLRMADGKTVKEWEGLYEIVSATGTISPEESHIHIAVSDQEGKVIGGHLKVGTIIDLTAELVVLAFDDVEYSREYEEATGYDMLVVKNK
ncbi:DNA-binding protein [Patescibacteria group bacterium]|nr:DNA-binding protein [Patescibacteria group bacterium]